MEKKIRFGDLVRNSGRPQPMTLWTDPKKDRFFSKAVKENRVITVIQDPASTRKGFGQIGYHEQPHAFYLAFPRPLPNENNSRVIGINYDLLEEPTVGRAARAGNTKQEPKQPERKIEPSQNTFRVTIRRTASYETEMPVSGKNETEAERKALELVKQEDFALSKAVMKDRIVRIHKRAKGS